MTKLIDCKLTNAFLVELLHLPATTSIIGVEMRGSNVLFKLADDTLHGDKARVVYSKSERNRKRKGEVIVDITAEYVTDENSNN